MIYNIYERDSKVVVEYSSYRDTHPKKYRYYDIGSLECSISSNRISVSKSDGTFVFQKVLFNKFRVGDALTLPSSLNDAKARIDKVLSGVGSRKYLLSADQSLVSFSGDVEYIDFPSSPYGLIENSLTSESLCIGDSEDSVRGTQNTLELRNLSSGAVVYYKMSLSIDCDESFTINVDSPSGQFQNRSTSQTSTSGSHRTVEVSGESSVTNNPNWKMSVSIDTEGSGSYRILSVEIKVTK